MRKKNILYYSIPLGFKVIASIIAVNSNCDSVDGLLSFITPTFRQLALYKHHNAFNRFVVIYPSVQLWLDNRNEEDETSLVSGSAVGEEKVVVTKVNMGEATQNNTIEETFFDLIVGHAFQKGEIGEVEEVGGDVYFIEGYDDESEDDHLFFNC